MDFGLIFIDQMRNIVKTNLLPVLLLISLCSLAQKKARVDTAVDSRFYKFAGNVRVDIRHATPAQPEMIARKERLMSIAKERFLFSVGENLYPTTLTLAVRFQKNTGAIIYEGNEWYWGEIGYLRRYLIDGKSDIEFADVKITPKNAPNYRYHVVVNDEKEIVGWTIPDQFKTSSDGKATFAYLGKYKLQPNGYLKIEIYNINNYKQKDAMIIDWRELKALSFHTTIDYRTKYWGTTILSAYLDLDKKNKQVNFLETENLNDVRFRLSDSLVRMSFFSSRLPTPYNYQIRLKRTIGNKTENIELGEHSGTYLLYKEFWNKAGLYEITFTPKLVRPGGSHVDYLRTKARSFKFTVLPPLTKGKWFSNKELGLIGLIWCAFFGGVVGSLLVWFKNKSRKKILKEQQQKDLAKIQLATVRSQLNPHFMFNALSGIQSLMNQDKSDEANHYLGKFARLTRNVLDQQDLISLAEEKLLLEDYLQMEQLRFGFKYQFHVAQDLNMDNIEIPSMLLQPFVENAIKHGDKGDQLEIEVFFIRKDEDLILKIMDNGVGFDPEKNYEGLGLQLSKNRISLLNTIYNSTPLILTMTSRSNQTEIKITLTQWL
jgi:two-component system LytT family sensor kinase